MEAAIIPIINGKTTDTKQIKSKEKIKESFKWKGIIKLPNFRLQNVQSI